MGDKTVKIEYQFTGEDVGLTTKIEDIYKKLDKLGEGASVTIKKLDGLNKETITLTNNLGNSSSKMNVFSSEMKEMQREIAQATAEVNRLNEALAKQQSLMASTGNKNAINNQKQLAQLTNESAKAMQNLASIQQKMKTSAIDFKGTPKFKMLEKDLNNVNKQLQIANQLSNQLSKNVSNKSYRIGGTNGISDIKNRKASAKAIEAETKAIEANTKAMSQQEKVRRKINNPTFRDSDYIRYKTTNDIVPFKSVRALPKLAKKYPEFKEIQDNLKAKEAVHRDYTDRIIGLNRQIEDFYRNRPNKHTPVSKEVLKMKDDLEKLKIEAKPYQRAYDVARLSTYRKMVEMDYEKYLGENAPEKYTPPTKNRRTLNQNVNAINQETKAIKEKIAVLNEEEKQIDNNISKITEKMKALTKQYKKGEINQVDFGNKAQIYADEKVDLEYLRASKRKENIELQNQLKQLGANEIQKETKAIEQNTKAKERNRRLSNRKNTEKNTDNKQQEVPFINIDKEREAFLKRNENRKLKNLVHQVNNGEIKNSDFDNIMKSELERSNTELKDTLTSLKAHGQSENHPDIADMMKDMRMENTLLKELDKAYEKHLDTINKVNTVKKDSFDLNKQRIKEISQKTGMSEKVVFNLSQAFEDNNMLEKGSRMDRLLEEMYSKEYTNGYKIQKAPFTDKAINQETKAITENTKAKTENRKITNATVKESPFSKEAGRITGDMKKITEAYNNGAKLNTSTDFKGTDLEISGRTVSEMYRSNNQKVKKLLSEYQKETAKRDVIAKTLPQRDNTLDGKLTKLNEYKKKLKAIENIENGEQSYRVKDDKSIRDSSGSYAKLTKNIKKLNKEIETLQKKSSSAGQEAQATSKEYIEQAVKAQKVLKDIDDVITKTNTKDKTYSLGDNRNYRKVASEIKEETKAIEENTTAQAKNYQVLGDLSKLKGKTLKTPSTASQTQEEVKNIGAIASEINNKAVQLQNALKNNDTAVIGQLQNEIRTLMAQRQALEKLQGKNLVNTSNTKYQKVDVVNATGSQKQIADTTNGVQGQIQAQNQLNNEKAETLKLEQQIAQQNAKTAKQTAKNIKNQVEADKQKHQLTLANIKAYEDSRQRQHQESREHANQKRQDSANFKAQQAYKKAVKQAPDELKNLTNAYKVATAQVKDESAKLEQFKGTIKKLASKGALNEEDFTKIEKGFTAQQKRIANANARIEKLNQRAEKVLNITGAEAQRLGNLSLKSGNKSYRVKNGQSISGQVGDIGKLNQYKKLVGDLGKSQKDLDKHMMDLAKNATNAGQSLLKLQNQIGSIGNITQLAGKGFINLGQGIQNLGNGMMRTGQNIQMVTNSLRMLSMVASGVFAYAGQQGIEFNRSLMGVASTLNRMSIDKKTGEVSVMPDYEFDGILENIASTAREQARKSAYTANQVMEGYRYTALAGWSADEMTDSMQYFIDMATVARIDGENFANVVDLITDSLASLGMAYEGIDLDGDGVFDDKIRKDAESLSKEVQHLSDVMIKAQSISNMDVNQLAEGYKIAGSQLSTFGLSVEEISTMFAVLANRGIKGTKAATGLSSIMANLTGKTGQAKKALDEITEKTGIDVYAWDKNGQYVGIEEHLNRLSKAFKKLKEMYGTEYGVDNLQLAQLLGGKHHFKSLTKLLEGYQTGEFDQVLSILKNSEGATAQMAKIANQSTWAQLKITISEVQEALLDLWTVIEPTFNKILKIIQEVAKAFTKLSDEQKMNIAKWGAMLIIGTALLSFFGMLAITIGGLVSTLGTLVVGFGKVIFAIGGIISAIAGFTGISSFIVGVMPALAPVVAMFTRLGVIIKAIGSASFAGIIASIGGLIKSASMLKDAFMDAYNSSESFGEFLLRSFMNMGDQFNHFVMNLAKKIVEMFNKLGPTVKNVIWNMFNALTMGLPKLFKGVLDKTGITKFFKEKTKGMSLDDLFESDLDRKAKAEGFESYKDKKSGRWKETTSKIVTTIFDGEETNAFSALIEKINNIKDGKVELSIDDLKADASSHHALMKSIESDYARKNQLEIDIAIDENKVAKLNKQIEETKRKLATATSQKDKDNLTKTLNDLTAKRDAQFELKIANEDELNSIIEDITKKEEKEITIRKIYDDNGLTDEFNYEDRKNEFEKNYGSKLSFVDAENDIKKVKELESSLVGMRNGLEAKLEMDLSPEEFNEVYFALEKVKSMQTNIPLYLELVNEQQVITNADTKLKELENKKAKIELQIEQTTTGKGLTIEQLSGNDKIVYDNLQVELGDINDEIAKELAKIEKAKTAISEINNGDLTGVYKLWDEMYSKYDEPLFRLFSDEEIALFNRIYGETKKEGGIDTSKTPTKGKTEFNNKAEKEASSSKKVGQDKIDMSKTPKKDKLEFDKSLLDGGEVVFTTKLEGFDEGYEKLAGISSIRDNNTNSTNANTQATQENTQANKENVISFEEQSEAMDNVSNKEIDTSGVEGLGEKSKEALEQVGGDTSQIVAKVQEVAQAISEMNFDGITGSMATMLVVVQEVRQMLSNIAGFAVNTGLSSFTTMGDGLKNALTESRTMISNISGVARNTGISAMTAMGNALTTALSGARTALLNICGVARNSGVSAMSAMGNALTSAINSAKNTVSGIANQINSIKNTASNIKIPAPAPSSLMTAPVSIVNSPNVASALRTINNTTTNSSIANTSNFNFNMSGIASTNRRDIRNTAKQLTTYCKRRGL